MPSTPRAANPIDAAGSSGSLLDRSTAKPHSIDMRIFDKKSDDSPAKGARIGQGTVTPSFVRKCHEEDPWPADSSCAPRSAARSSVGAKVVLSDCRIDTPEEDLATDQPFEMSCEARSEDGNPITGSVYFRLFCITAPDKPPEDTHHAVEGKLKEGRFCAEGTLFSPISRVEWGAPLKYHVVAQHSAAKEKAKSAEVGVEANRPPKPFAVFSLPERYFYPGTSFIMPTAKGYFEELNKIINDHGNPGVSIFGHSNSSTEDDVSLSGRRAYSMYCLLTQNTKGWLENYRAENWGAQAAFIMDEFSKDARTNEEFIQKYFDYVCKCKINASDFLGDPSDPSLRFACMNCAQMNPFNSGDGTATNKNSTHNDNARVSIAIFPPAAKGIGRTEFPCPNWHGSSIECKRTQHFNLTTPQNTTEASKRKPQCLLYQKMTDSESLYSEPEYTITKDITVIEFDTNIIESISSELHDGFREADIYDYPEYIRALIDAFAFLESNSDCQVYFVTRANEPSRFPQFYDQAEFITAMLLGDERKAVNLCYEYRLRNPHQITPEGDEEVCDPRRIAGISSLSDYHRIEAVLNDHFSEEHLISLRKENRARCSFSNFEFFTKEPDSNPWKMVWQELSEDTIAMTFIDNSKRDNEDAV